MEKWYLAGGCFWCMEKPYHTLPGVLSVTSGYCGGDEVNPTYKDVKSQKTKHRETVEIVFDERVIRREELLDIYMDSINPFDDGGQFIDRGYSYTCAIYYTTEEQKELAEQRVTSLELTSGQKVAVAIEPFKVFYRAEEYHQDYAHKNPEAYQKEYEESGRAAYQKEKDQK